MRKKLKIILIALVAIILSGGLVILGLKTYAYSIRNLRNCKWANIDNVELNAKVDIPAIKKSDCHYNDNTNTKMTFFEIDQEQVDLNQYHLKNKLQLVENIPGIEIEKFYQLNPKSLTSSELYFRKNISRDAYSYILFNKTTASLWVTIEYRN